MKKYLTLILVLVITATLMAGCSLFSEPDKSANVTDDSGKIIETEKASSAEKSSETDNDKPSDKESSKNKSNRKATEKTSGKKTKEKAAGKKAKEKTAAKKAKEKAAEKKAKEKAASKKKAKDSAQKKKERKDRQSAKKKKRNASAKNSTAAQKTCTIKITCHKLVENNSLDEAQRARVPSDGIIMSSVKIRIEDGDSVYDVLKRACKEKGIVLAAENTSLGIYVAGIDGFYEKDAGSESGWKYKINGSYPGDSAGDVKVKDGDIIEWEYALEA